MYSQMKPKLLLDLSFAMLIKHIISSQLIMEIDFLI